MNPYDKHMANRKRVDDHNKSQKMDRAGKRAERRAWQSSAAIVMPAPTNKYRDGWDRIFGGVATNDERSERDDDGTFGEGQEKSTDESHEVGGVPTPSEGNL